MKKCEVDMRAKLIELFPPDHDDSPWLLRLMIIRDDLEYELRNLWLEKGASQDDVWRCSYFLRRITISLLEAKNVLVHEVAKVIKRPKDDLLKGLVPHLRKTIAAIESQEPVLLPIRDALGGHVRPQSAGRAGMSVERTVLKNAPNLQGAFRVSFGDVRLTSFRELTSAAIFFAWPDVDDNQKSEESHAKLSAAIFSSILLVLRSIDSLLVRHWWSLGVVTPPPGVDLAFMDSKTKKPVRLKRPVNAK
jgi:hypothetical protein